MTERQENFLQHIVEDYIKYGEPVGSKSLGTGHNIDLSPATIRNEMAELESEGLIMQPHTSAGRIPTVGGFEYYVRNILTEKKLSAKEDQRFRSIFKKHGAKQLAKDISTEVKTAVMLVRENNFYYTGFSQLFHHRAGLDPETMYAVGSAIDNIEHHIEYFLSAPNEKTTVYIGSSNPLGAHCSLIIAQNDEFGAIGLVSPLRTNYARNLGLINSVIQYIHE